MRSIWQNIHLSFRPAAALRCRGCMRFFTPIELANTGSGKVASANITDKAVLFHLVTLRIRNSCIAVGAAIVTDEVVGIGHVFEPKIVTHLVRKRIAGISWPTIERDYTTSHVLVILIAWSVDRGPRDCMSQHHCKSL